LGLRIKSGIEQDQVRPAAVFPRAARLHVFPNLIELTIIEIPYPFARFGGAVAVVTGEIKVHMIARPVTKIAEIRADFLLACD